MIGTQSIVLLILCGLLTIAISVAAVIVFKKKYSGSSFISALIGAATFVVFALVLEQVLHFFMLPLVTGSTVAYVIYGTLAAGVFEETGRFVACKTLMKKRSDNANAVMMGLGHGGIEAIILVGMSVASMLVMGIMVNSMGFDGFVQSTGLTDEAQIELLKAQVDSVAAFSVSQCLVSVIERIIAMTLHVCMSVIVMKAASVKGKIWLFPAAILLHAIFDVPAALGQRKVIPNVWIVEICLAVIAAVMVLIALKASKIKQPAPEAETEANV